MQEKNLKTFKKNLSKVQDLIARLSFVQKEIKKALPVLLLIFLVGCATNLRHRYTWDPELLPYISEFIEVYGIVPEANIRLKELRDNFGTADTFRRAIFIDTTFFNNASRDMIEEVLFHELGHYIFGRDHYSALITSGEMMGCQKSLMSATDLASSTMCYARFRAYYLQELKHGPY